MKKNMCYDYFNLTDNEINKDHIWDKSLFPPCTSDKNNYHAKSSLCFNSRLDFKKYIADKARRGEKVIVFKLSGQEKTENQVMSVIQEALQSVLNGFSMKLHFNNKLGTGMVCLD